MGKYEKKSRHSGGRYQRHSEKKGSGKILAVLLGIAALLVMVIMIFDPQGQTVPGSATEELQEQTTEAAVQMQEPAQTQPEETAAPETVQTQPAREEPEQTQAAWFDYLLDRISGEEEPGDPAAQSAEPETTQPSQPVPVGTKAQRMTYMEMASGDLVLVNDTYGFPEGGASVTTLHDKASPLYHVENINLRVQPHVVDPLNKWVSTFSSETGNREVLVIRGSGTEDAGVAEFHTGLAVELDTYHIGTTMDGDEVYQQLAETAWQYGFVRRCPVDDTEKNNQKEQAQEPIVGSGNPWHFRYVGIPHSAIMEKKDLSLEEYLEYLRDYTLEEGPLETEYEGVQYEIYFCEGLEITVPLNRSYSVSGNNVDGFIVTVCVAG